MKKFKGDVKNSKHKGGLHMEEIKFETPEKMLEVLASGSDLYNPKLEMYIFSYNDLGSICVYTQISEQYAKELSRQTLEGMEGSYWGSFLGYKHSAIYDTLEWYKENEKEYDGLPTPLDICKSLYRETGWATTENFELALTKSSPVIQEEMV